MKKEVIITGIFSIASAIISATISSFISSDYKENKINSEIMQVVNVDSGNYSDIISDLLDDVYQLKTSNEQLVSENNSLKNLNSELEIELEQPQTALNDLETEINSLKEENNQLKQNNEEINAQLIELNNMSNVEDPSIIPGEAIQLIDLEIFAGKRTVIPGILIDNLGNEHKNSITSASDATYAIDGKYKTLRGLAFFIQENIGSLRVSTLRIYGDDNLLYSLVIEDGVRPESFEIDITGVNNLVINHYSGSSHFPSAVTDLLLFQ